MHGRGPSPAPQEDSRATGALILHPSHTPYFHAQISNRAESKLSRACVCLKGVAVLSALLACALLVLHHVQARPSHRQQPVDASLQSALGILPSHIPCQSPFDIALWPEGQVPMYAQGQAPYLTAYLPANGNASASVVIAPGGAYVGVAADVEGVPYARWLCAHGIASYVLYYRLGGMGYYAPVPETDAKRAIRIARSRAAGAYKVG